MTREELRDLKLKMQQTKDNIATSAKKAKKKMTCKQSVEEWREICLKNLAEEKPRKVKRFRFDFWKQNRILHIYREKCNADSPLRRIAICANCIF
jgi:hypothetical protein